MSGGALERPRRGLRSIASGIRQAGALYTKPGVYCGSRPTALSNYVEVAGGSRPSGRRLATRRQRRCSSGTRRSTGEIAGQAAAWVMSGATWSMPRWHLDPRGPSRSIFVRGHPRYPYLETRIFVVGPDRYVIWFDASQLSADSISAEFRDKTGKRAWRRMERRLSEIAVLIGRHDRFCGLETKGPMPQEGLPYGTASREPSEPSDLSSRSGQPTS